MSSKCYNYTPIIGGQNMNKPMSYISTYIKKNMAQVLGPNYTPLLFHSGWEPHCCPPFLPKDLFCVQNQAPHTLTY